MTLDATVAAPPKQAKRQKPSFVEKTLAGIAGNIEQAVFSEENARRNGFLQRRDPRVKVVGGLAIILAAALSRDWPILLALYFLVVGLAWVSAIDMGLFFKRVLDIFVSALALILLSPFLAVLSIWIKLDSPGTVLYKSQRVGKKGRVFTCYKFRTMVPDADKLKDSLRHLNEREGPFFKITDDPRVTRLGKFLRKYSVDELPQLLNVFKGDMSLVGPRPHPLDDYKQYDLDHLRRLEVKPGITGLWQVTARQHPSFETNMRLDLHYIDNWNLGLDLKVLLRTLSAVLRAEGS